MTYFLPTPTSTWLSIRACRPCIRAIGHKGLLLCSILFAHTTYADHPDNVIKDGPALTPSQLIESVLANNPALDTSQAEEQALLYHAAASGRLTDPQLTLGLAPNTFASDVTSRAGARYTVKVSQQLPWPGTLRLEEQIASHAAAAAKNNVAQVRRNLIAHAQQTWAQWWYVAQAIALNKRTEKAFKRLASTAQTQYENGSGLQQDLLLAQTKLLHSQHKSIALQRQQLHIRNHINALQLLPSNTLVTPPANMPKLPGQFPPLNDLEALLRSHPTLTKEQTNEQQHRSHYQLAEQQKLPNFNLELAYIGPLDPADKRLQVGVSLNLPFDQAKRSATSNAAAALQQASISKQQQLYANLLQRLQDERANYAEQQHVVQLYSQQLNDYAARNLRATETDYANGHGNLTAVAEATQQNLQVATALALARANQFSAYAQLTELLGADWLTLSSQPNSPAPAHSEHSH